MAQPAYTRSQLMALAAADARKHGIDPAIFTRQIQQESGFNPAAQSGAGAVGIAQFMPATARSYGIDPTNPVQALDAAARYDQNELQAFGGDYRKALAAYNAGAGNADKFNDPSFAGGQTYRYVRSILGGAAPAAAPTVTMPSAPARSPLAAAAAAAQPAPRPSLLPALTQASQGGDYTGFFQQLGNALHQQNTAPVAPLPAASNAPLPAAPLPAVKGQAAPVVPLVGASVKGVRPSLLDAVTQAAKAAGASEIRVTSGARSADHNASVGGVSHSNHLTGDALDGYGLVNGQWVPLGQLLLKTAGRYGLRSGDVPGFFNGRPDPVHIDDAANMRGRR